MDSIYTSSRIDPFFSRQPEKRFVEELKRPVHMNKPLGFGKGFRGEGQADLSGMYLDVDFSDPENLLETAYEDFQAFLKVCEMGGHRYPLRIRQIPAGTFEAYTLTVTEENCTLSAGDTEGIRRGLVYLEDLLIRSEGPYLDPQTVTRRPRIKSRITRGFFSPTNRPPHNVDELENDIDYYPDEYLNRLAHDGTNGIWIYTRFRELLTSSVFPEYGKNSAKRLEKLQDLLKEN